MNQQVSRLTLPTIALSLMTVVSAVAGLNLALPKIAVETGATQTQLTWIVDSYTVIFAGLLLISGAIGDKYGRRRILFIGLLIFAFGASIGFFANSPSTLIIARLVMGIGAAGIMPSTLSVITTSFPPESRGKAIGVWVGVAGGGAVLGLFATALLLEWFNWNSFFALNFVFAIISAVGTLKVPESRESDKKKIDLIGGLLSILGIGGLVFGIIEGPEKGWSSPESIAGIAVGSIALLCFALWELRTNYPLLNPRLFKSREFSAGTLSITIQFFAQFGFIFVGMQYLQFVAGKTPLQAATQLLWMPLVVLPGSRIAGELTKKVPQKYIGSAGLAIFGYSLFHFSSLPLQFDYWYFTIGILLFGTGLAFSATPATVAITSSLPEEKQGVASAVNDTAREVGSAIGIAILGAAMTGTYKSEMAKSTIGLPTEISKKLESSVAFTQMKAPELLADKWEQLVSAGLSAFNSGVQTSLTIGGWVSITGAVIVLIIAPRKNRVSGL
jgi:EmrB/QacA subfamily drug resistance transporter